MNFLISTDERFRALPPCSDNTFISMGNTLPSQSHTKCILEPSIIWYLLVVSFKILFDTCPRWRLSFAQGGPSRRQNSAFSFSSPWNSENPHFWRFLHLCFQPIKLARSPCLCWGAGGPAPSWGTWSAQQLCVSIFISIQIDHIYKNIFWYSNVIFFVQ